MKPSMLPTLLTLCLVLLSTASPAAEPPTLQLRLLGAHSLAKAATFEGLPVGGLSGLERLPDGRFVALSDASRREDGPPRFYTLALDYDQFGFHGVRILGQQRLLQPDGQPFEAGPTVDAEDIRRLPDGHLVWSSEGIWHADAAQRRQPFVRSMGTDGRFVREHALPEGFALVDNHSRGARKNKLIEALAVTPAGQLYAANEDALIQDGPAASPQQGAWLRLVALDAAGGPPGVQYAYPLPKVPAAGDAGAALPPDNGLVGLLALGERRFIGVERSYAQGVGNTIRLVEIRIPADASDVRALPSLNAADARFTPLQRRLLLELGPQWNGLKIDNIEAIAWGHRLANGRPTVVLASDNNFNDRQQITQFIVFELDGVDGPDLADGSAPPVLRVASFNASLNRDAAGELLADLAAADGPAASEVQARRLQQARNVAEILQRVRADVLLVNEFDLDLDGRPGASGTPMAAGYSSRAAALFQQNFLARPQGHAVRGFTAPLHYPYRHTPNTNTGIASGLDLDRNGRVVNQPETPGYGADALGFGQFAGQYGMTVYSQYPILSVRSFQNLRWLDLPGNLLQHDASPGEHNLARFYPPEAQQRLKLSSKNHVDVALCVQGRVLHFLVSHPTPPAFDGPEDRNGKRNHDELRLWTEYLDGAAWLVDDQGQRGGLAAGALFVVAGDLNADALDGDALRSGQDGRSAIERLLQHPRVDSRAVPLAPGGVDARDHPANNGDANLRHRGDPAHDTADFSDAAPGNLRVDYVLPSVGLDVLGAGIFWPADNNRQAPNASGHVFDLIGTFRDPALYAGHASSDHKAVWVDLRLPLAAAGGPQACVVPPRAAQ